MCLVDLHNATYWPSYDYYCQYDTFTHQLVPSTYSCIQYLQILVSGLVYKVLVIIKYINKTNYYVSITCGVL